MIMCPRLPKSWRLKKDHNHTAKGIVSVNVNWKRILFVVADLVLAAYLVMAVTVWNTPPAVSRVCSKVDIQISDANNVGFLSAEEIKHILTQKELYPLGKPISSINPRSIEDVLRTSAFVNTAECHVTQGGHVVIDLTQRVPIIRIKNARGDDYYVDDEGGPMPNSRYTSDLVVATGNITRAFARSYITPMAKAIMASDFWRNQVVQINVLPNRGIELVPRVGDHVLYLGRLPESRYRSQREKMIAEFMDKKLTRIWKFYRYGLSQTGWNKYNYIDVEFDNQIICKKRKIE